MQWLPNSGGGVAIKQRMLVLFFDEDPCEKLFGCRAGVLDYPVLDGLGEVVAKLSIEFGESVPEPRLAEDVVSACDQANERLVSLLQGWHGSANTRDRID